MNPGEIEVRYPARTDGSTPLDEIVGQGVNIHLEQMDDSHWSMQIGGNGKTVTVLFHTISVRWNDDELVHFETAGRGTP